MELTFLLVPLQKQIKTNWEFWSSFQLLCQDYSPIYIFLTNCTHFPSSPNASACGIYFWPSCMFGTRVQTTISTSIPNPEFLLPSNPHSVVYQINSFGFHKTYFPLNTTLWENLRNTRKPEADYFMLALCIPA